MTPKIIGSGNCPIRKAKCTEIDLTSRSSMSAYWNRESLDRQLQFAQSFRIPHPVPFFFATTQSDFACTYAVACVVGTYPNISYATNALVSLTPAMMNRPGRSPGSSCSEGGPGCSLRCPSQPLKVGFQVIGQIGDACNFGQRGWVISLCDFRLLGDAVK